MLEMAIGNVIVSLQLIFKTKTKQNMELNQGEFDTLTKKLEQYAAQLSTLQTKLELQPEIVSLRDQLASVQLKLDEVTAERDEYKRKYEDEHERYEALENDMTTAMVENAWLKNCIILSLTSIRAFMRRVKRLEVKSLFFTFLHKTILPEMGPRSIQAIDDTIDLQDIGELEKLADQIIMENNGQVIKQDIEEKRA